MFEEEPSISGDSEDRPEGRSRHGGLCVKGCGLEGGSARLSLWSLLARQTCRQALALPWLLGGTWRLLPARPGLKCRSPTLGVSLAAQTAGGQPATLLSAWPRSQALLASFVREASTLTWRREQFHTSPPPLCNRVLRDCRGSSGGGSQFMVGGRRAATRPSTHQCLSAFPGLSCPACSTGLLTLGS